MYSVFLDKPQGLHSPIALNQKGPVTKETLTPCDWAGGCLCEGRICQHTGAHSGLEGLLPTGLWAGNGMAVKGMRVWKLGSPLPRMSFPLGENSRPSRSVWSGRGVRTCYLSWSSAVSGRSTACSACQGEGSKVTATLPLPSQVCSLRPLLWLCPQPLTRGSQNFKEPKVGLIFPEGAGARSSYRGAWQGGSQNTPGPASPSPDL